MYQDPVLDVFYGLLRINSPSGQEGEMAAYLVRELEALGWAARIDTVGNVIAFADGEGEPLLLSAHMDTVEPTLGISVITREDGTICTDGSTILGADCKAGVAVTLEAVRRAGKRPPLDIVFTAREETGLVGAKGLDVSVLRARRGIVLDAGGSICTLVTAAPSQFRLTATVIGKAAHAGVAPEEGVNAILAAARGIVAMPLGRIDEETTANLGVIHGGLATNIVPERVQLRGEARSHDEAKLQAQVDAMRTALEAAALGMGARAEVAVERSYTRFAVPDEHPLVQAVLDAARAHGCPAETIRGGGGSDANVFNAAGIECINFSVGMAASHSKGEYIACRDLMQSADLLTAVLARLAG